MSVQAPSVSVVYGNFDWDLYERQQKQPYQGRRPYHLEHLGGAEAQAGYAAMERSIERLQVPEPGSVVTGRVVSVANGLAHVDVGWREDVVVDLRKEPDHSLDELVRGASVELLVERVDNAGSRPTMASHGKLSLMRVKEELMSSIGKPFAFSAYIGEMIENAGYVVDVAGIKCFMPGSLAGMNKVVDFSSMVGRTVYVVPINYSQARDCVVVSHREYLKTLVPVEMSKIKEGDRLSGFVTGTSSHGVFVEFNGCLTGLVPRNDLLPETAARLSEIPPGSEFDFYVKEIIDTRIVLSEKPIEPSPWETADELLRKTVVGRVKKVMAFGAFVEVKPRLVGLLHKSYLRDSDIVEVGMEIEVTVVKVDREARRMDLAV